MLELESDLNPCSRSTFAFSTVTGMSLYGPHPRDKTCQTRTPPQEPKSQCHSSPKRLAPSGAAISVIPLMLPPGRVRLAMKPVLIGSAARPPITVGTEARERLTTRGGT